MSFAYLVPQNLSELYSEIFQIAKINIEPYRSGNNYTALILDGIEECALPQTVCPLWITFSMPGIENPAGETKSFDFSLGKQVRELWTNGRPLEEAGSPGLDVLLDQLKNTLGNNGLLLEIPPSPWGYKYSVSLTHDIDLLSIAELPIGKTLLGYIYRNIVVSFRNWRKQKIRFSQFVKALGFGIGAPLIRIFSFLDPVAKSIDIIEEIESQFDVTSSLYFIPSPGYPGKGTEGGSAPANRAAFYDLSRYKARLKALEDQGWELGLHGLDTWNSNTDATIEFTKIKEALGVEDFGCRMHWLYFAGSQSFTAIDQSPLVYDSTWGYNEVVGFKGGTLQAFRPPGCKNMLELPLIIQDGALLGEWNMDLDEQSAISVCKEVLNWGQRLDGTVTVLWHNNSFVPPRFWGNVYKEIISTANSQGAWISNAKEIVKWYQFRREAQLPLIEHTGQKIRLTWPEQKISLGDKWLKVRLYIEPANIKSCSSEYVGNQGYIEVKADAPVVEICLKDEI